VYVTASLLLTLLLNASKLSKELKYILQNIVKNEQRKSVCCCDCGDRRPAGRDSRVRKIVWIGRQLLTPNVVTAHARDTIHSRVVVLLHFT
jgi:hypothetical protein